MKAEIIIHEKSGEAKLLLSMRDDINIIIAVDPHQYPGLERVKYDT